MTDSFIETKDGKAICHSGPDAMRRIQAITLSASLGLWAETKIIPTRGMGITYMLDLCQQITGQKFKRTQIALARDALDTFADEMLAALPIIEKGEGA